ncbi:hypothetical protein DDB_G0273211 [Dictyostelium discoideum AX4]|uniref:Uncharacterized protein n=1 Tax=Dictyostelium discoideum TaxID=44689 RepID=Q556Z4_DICDI|nr:hypothetical protein DDB_G0273717 [Dictyostelium discoideum AX4]XP_644775.1 hypothetical protein DDB_G0273211 [Dictyostelium discoideum AX4]EAL70549.1 hypothetical protein DDB_G0273717 [Dictyostelium discoideum AX4]EAL70823.1 hypothetical protein DDB_G0273211 [Dictyostelium discoideum AX4]|eukprot:XP_644475.1 hypothetical protein DDB_G0273717 [Dictyostelium discoideum AX4]
MKLSDPFDYENDLKYAESQPVSFWDDIAKKYIHWDKMYDKVYSGDEMYPDWFKGGELNTCYNVLDIQVQNPLKRDQDALIYECPFLKKTVKLTYYQLYEKVCEFSRVLLNLNISKNDNILIFMANTVEAPIAMLSCARIGATHCVLFDGYSTKSLIDRIEAVRPKVIITSNYGILNEEIITFTPNLIEAIEISTFKPDHVITHNRDLISSDAQLSIIETIPTVPSSLDWDLEINKIKENNQTPFYEYVTVESSHPLYIIYTSGTTGNSKGVVRSNGPHLVCFGYLWPSIVQKNTTFFSHTSIGWVSFHSFLYASLLHGCSFVMFEGGIVKPKHMEDDIWSIVEKHKVSAFLTLAKTIRYLNKVDPDAKQIHSKYDISSLKSIWNGGEVIEDSIPEYIENKLKSRPSIGYGQTETGYLYLFDYIKSKKNPYNTVGPPSPFVYPSILSEDGIELPVNQIGEIVFKLPLPPGFASTFYKNDEQFKKVLTKFPGYYSSGDLGYKDENGYYAIVSRADDQIKIGGNKVQLNTIETSILKHPNVIECCSIGIYNPDCYNKPIGLLTLKQQDSNVDLIQLKNEINSIITQDIDKFAQLTHIIIVEQLPKTKSGKIQRLIISKFLNDNNFKLPDHVFESQQIYTDIKNLYLNNL